MSVPEESLSILNVRLSVQSFLNSVWATPRDLLVGWSDAGFDPDAAGDLYDPEPASVWAAMEWLANGAGAHSYALLQVDVFSRTSADPLGRAVLKEADELGKALRAAPSFPIYDFSDVEEEEDEEELIPGNRILVQVPGGRIGDLLSTVGPTLDGGTWRVTVTVAFRLLSDTSRSGYYPSA